MDWLANNWETVMTVMNAIGLALVGMKGKKK